MATRHSHHVRSNKMVWNPARMRALRVKRGISMTDLSKQIDTSVATIKRYEMGEVEPKVNRAVEIARILGTTLAYLVEETDEADPVLALKDLRPNERKLVRALRDGDLQTVNTIMVKEAREQINKKK